MAEVWTNIGAYIQKLVWGKDRANELKGNVQFVREVLEQWHALDVGLAGDVAGQGYSKQLRHANKTNGGVQPTNALRCFVTPFNFIRTGNAAAPRSYLADTQIDWRRRNLVVVAWRLDANALPTQASDEAVAWGVDIDGSGTPVVQSYFADNMAGKMIIGGGYTEDGMAFDVAITSGNARGAMLTMGTPLLILAAAGSAGTSAAGETIALGNLIVTLNTDIATETFRFAGMIFATGDY